MRHEDEGLEKKPELEADGEVGDGNDSKKADHGDRDDKETHRKHRDILYEKLRKEIGEPSSQGRTRRNLLERARRPSVSSTRKE